MRKAKHNLQIPEINWPGRPGEAPTLLIGFEKVATSSGPSGTVAGVQFVAVFQSALVGLRFQVALPALRLMIKAKVKVKKMNSLAFTVIFMGSQLA